MSEAIKQFNSLIRPGIVDSVEGAKARVIVQDKTNKRKTAPLPVLMHASKYKREYSPVWVGDPVIVVAPEGDPDRGFCVRGQFLQDIPKPAQGNDTTEATVYEDGTVIAYDTAAKRLFASFAGDVEADITGNVTLNVQGDVTAKINGSLSAEAADATIKADAVTVDSADINLGNGGQGVVTKECVCAFTGAPHVDASGNTKSKK